MLLKTRAFPSTLILLSQMHIMQVCIAEDIFTHPPTFLGGESSYAQAIGDLDGDGDQDVVSVHVKEADSVWLNTDTGLVMQQSLLDNTHSVSVALGDIDADGDLDAVVGSANGQTNRIWLNNGQSQLTESNHSLGNADFFAVALADLDADGDLDLFAGVHSAADQVWLNDGQGLFTESSQNLGTQTAYGVALADVDKDGDIDAFVANNYNQANTVWLNDGQGTLTDSGQLLGNSASQSIALADVNADTYPDAVVANHFGQANMVWLNDGQGIFVDSGQHLGDWASYAVAVADVNGDGHIDAVFGNRNQPNQVWLNDGTGIFALAQQVGNAASYALNLMDMNADLSPDLLVANNFGQPDALWANQIEFHETQPGCIQDDFEQVTDSWSEIALGGMKMGTFAAVDGQLHISAGGYNFWTNDQVYFVYQQAEGDFRVETDIIDIPVDIGNSNRKIGLMVRAETQAKKGRDQRILVAYAPNYRNKGPTLMFGYRAKAGKAGKYLAKNVLDIQLPVRVAIEKQGDVYTVFYSTDQGNTWIQPTGYEDGSISLSMGEQLLTGYAVASYRGTPLTGAFDNFSLCKQ